MLNWANRSGTVASVVVALMSLVPHAVAAGIQMLEVPSDGSMPALVGAVWYPCTIEPTPLALGPIRLSAARDCPIDATKLPLVVISHGHAGSYLGHRDTAQALADAGFVVAAVSHPGDNAQDSSRSDGLSVFAERPSDIKRLVDYLLGSWGHASAIDPDRIGVFGYSRGGYTGLVVVGAQPRFAAATGACAGKTSGLCDEIRHGRSVPVVHDSRVKAAVIADPLSVFFTSTSFDDVHVPIQLWRSQRGGDGVTPDSIAAVAEALPQHPDFRTVPNAQHFSFLPPCPPDMARRLPELCTDLPDFDREAFHKEFNAQVLDFFRRALR
jgi:predicted dienelactone hydrolase